MYVNLKKARCGLINYGRIRLTCSEVLIFLFAHLSAVQEILQTLRLNLLMLKHGHLVRRNTSRLEAVQILVMHRHAAFRFVFVARMVKNTLHTPSTIRLLHHLECLSHFLRTIFRQMEMSVFLRHSDRIWVARSF